MLVGHGRSSPVGREHGRWFDPANHTTAFARLFHSPHTANEAQISEIGNACFYLSLRVLSRLFLPAML